MVIVSACWKQFRNWYDWSVIKVLMNNPVMLFPPFTECDVILITFKQFIRGVVLLPSETQGIKNENTAALCTAQLIEECAAQTWVQDLQLDYSLECPEQ